MKFVKALYTQPKNYLTDSSETTIDLSSSLRVRRHLVESLSNTPANHKHFLTHHILFPVKFWLLSHTLLLSNQSQAELRLLARLLVLCV